MSATLLWSAVAAFSTLTAVWLISLRARDASIVDIAWGFGFTIVAWTSFIVAGDPSPYRWTLAVLTTVWGVRLGVHIFRRNHGAEEDYRYQAMRRRWGARFPLVSLATVFWLQAALLFVVSLPVQAGIAHDDGDGLNAFAFIGVALWLIGFTFEAGGDLQLQRFKADPANEGAVMDSGFWRYTRHPNYFGDACAWWGLTVVSLAAGGPWWVLVGPAVMTFLLLRVSGVAMLERTITSRRPGYAEYVRRTSAFIPLPPKRAR